MEWARSRFKELGLSLDEIGRRMGYSPTSASKSAWQFLNMTEDPRLSMLYRLADAFQVSVSELLDLATGDGSDQSGFPTPCDGSGKIEPLGQ
jgi:transcriptional regulator with XRE-family HTH domain